MCAGVRSVSRELASTVGESTGQSLSRHQVAAGLERAIIPASDVASRRMAQWWSVRSAGGLYQVLRRIPDALPRLSLVQVTETAGPLCAKAGIRLSTWRPAPLLYDGTEMLLSIPPERGLKYLAAQAVQAGVSAIGFRKMEEYLASRRPSRSGVVSKEFGERWATEFRP